MIKIWHLATHSTNIGDAALIYGMHTTMREDWRRPVEFISDPLMDYDNYWGKNKFDSLFVERVNSECDLLLIGGGGMMDGGRKDYNTGMAFNIPLDLLKSIRTPVVFYALGHNLFPNQKYRHSQKLLQSIRAITSSKSMIFSVRNDGTLGRLRDMLNDPLDAVVEIPDPGLYVPVSDTIHHVFMPDRFNILIQLAGDNPFNRFNCHLWRHIPLASQAILRRRMRSFFSRIGKMLQKIDDEYPVNFVLCPHLVRDFSVMGEFVASLPTGFTRFRFNASETLRGVDSAPFFFDLYKKADLVIGMRGHSVVCSVGTGTPVIALSTHDKIKGFMDKVGLSHRTVEISDPLATNKLYSNMRELLQNNEQEQNKLFEIRQACREKTAEFHKEILSLLRI
ncbi:MAG: hypothetical protein C4538_05205 [Nitrospiraceae bacterium]|nr:MAG: hypothetical protein C4538_05205 [Nitrospiraceae bacterium]